MLNSSFRYVRPCMKVVVPPPRTTILPRTSPSPSRCLSDICYTPKATVTHVWWTLTRTPLPDFTPNFVRNHDMVGLPSRYDTCNRLFVFPRPMPDYTYGSLSGTRTWRLRFRSSCAASCKHRSTACVVQWSDAFVSTCSRTRSLFLSCSIVFVWRFRPFDSLSVTYLVGCSRHVCGLTWRS